METTERRALTDAVRKFAEAELEPHAIEWDEQKHFPVDVLRTRRRPRARRHLHR